MTYRNLMKLLPVVLALLLFQCSEEEIKVNDELHDPQMEAQAMRTDALVIGAVVTWTCEDGGCDDYETGYEYQFDLGGSGITLKVSWGDGTESTHQINGEEEIIHNYAERGRYTITIRGDLNKITSFRAAAYGRGDFRSINFGALPNLQIVDLVYIGGIAPVTVDLTRNPALRYVTAPGSSYMWNFVLPRTHFIEVIHIDGPSGLDASDVDKIISNIYLNAVSKNIKGGIFTLRKELWIEDDYEMMGPPSESSLAKLRVLRDKYDWYIYPLDGQPFDWDRGYRPM